FASPSTRGGEGRGGGGGGGGGESVVSSPRVKVAISSLSAEEDLVAGLTSAVACGREAVGVSTGVSPRPIALGEELYSSSSLASRRGGKSARRGGPGFPGCGSPRPVAGRGFPSSSPRARVGSSPRAAVGAGYPDGMDWWNELELSPSRVEMPGLQRWRDNRRTAAPSLHASVSEQQTSSDTNSADAEDSSASSPVLFSSTSSSNKLSRSYVTLLAAAAAAEESRGISPALRDLGGYLDHSRRWGSGRMASSSTIVDGQPPRAAADSFARDRDRDSDDRIRRLEAENLRLRFRVADLEGQVSVMEDELERRGVRSNGPAEDHNSSGDGRQWSISKPGSEAGSGGGDEAASSPWGTGGGGEPVLSPRGRGYLARLVVDVCKELDQSRKAVVRRESTGSGSGSVPRSERLCKVLPKVMETAIKGVRDLDEQVFEQMMQAAAERMPPPPPPPPPGTPARRLSSCVVARDGGGEFFAQSPAPGRPASFFRLGEPRTPGKPPASSSSTGTVGGSGGARGSPPESARERRTRTRSQLQNPAVSVNGPTSNPGVVSRSNPETPKRNRGAGRILAVGEWWASAFTPTASTVSPRSRAGTEQGVSTPPASTASSSERQDILSFEGSAEEVLRYTIVAK
ncbi:unnamed protein product, partial [Sphacelaria rigidula]